MQFHILEGGTSSLSSLERRPYLISHPPLSMMHVAVVAIGISWDGGGLVDLLAGGLLALDDFFAGAFLVGDAFSVIFAL